VIVRSYNVSFKGHITLKLFHIYLDTNQILILHEIW